MNPEQWCYLFVLPITFIFEYLKIFNDTESPLFFKYGIKLPLFFYMVCQGAVSFVVVFGIAELLHPANLVHSLLFAILSSFVATGLVPNTEIKILEIDINRIKTKTDEWKTTIVTLIKKERTSVLRSLASKLAKAKTIEDLRSELLGIMEHEDFEIFEKTMMNWSEEDKVVVYAQKIVEIDSEVARRLLS